MHDSLLFFAGVNSFLLALRLFHVLFQSPSLRGVTKLLVVVMKKSYSLVLVLYTVMILSALKNEAENGSS